MAMIITMIAMTWDDDDSGGDFLSCYMYMILIMLLFCSFTYFIEYCNYFEKPEFGK